MNPKFTKISYNQWHHDLTHLSRHSGYITVPDNTIEELYNHIQLPNRSVEMSNGYHFRNAYVDIQTKPYYPSWYEPCIIPTGIKVEMDQNLVLQIHSYHILSRCHNLIIADGVQIIPSGYAGFDEGHIVILLRNLSMHRHVIKTGDVIGVGIFTSVIPIVPSSDECEYAPVAPAIIHSPHKLTNGVGPGLDEYESVEHPIGGPSRARLSFI